MRKLLIFLMCVTLISCFVCPISAAEISATDTAAEDITASTQFSGVGYSAFSFLWDKDVDTYKTSSGNTSITLNNAQGMACLYLLFDLEYGAYTITNADDGKIITAGEYEMLHEYIDLVNAFGTLPTSITLNFSNGSVRLSEIYVFSGTDVPAFVQKWEPPLEEGADILLFPTHGDDDQLYFAGLMPLYAKEKGCRVQVVYLTDHRNLTNARTHEMINGLWNVGVTAYPVFGRFADFRIDDLEGTYSAYENTYGTSRDKLQGFVVEQIRRFKPLVAVGHDLQGEYGHGMHKLYAYLLTQAISMSNNPEIFPESAEEYGTWALSKLYLHLYEQNPIVMDYDQPLASFQGMTAFEVTQKLGFPCHKSQQWTSFVSWLYGYNKEITKATQIKKYNPCKFGLYFSSVGEDVAKNDFLENITTYDEQERLEQEWLEQERLEEELLQQDQLEQGTKEEETQPPAPQKKRAFGVEVVILVILIALFILLVIIRMFMKNKRRSRKHLF